MHYSIIFTIKIAQTKIVLIILNLVITGICKTRYDYTIEKKTKYLRTVFKNYKVYRSTGNGGYYERE